MHDAAMVQGLRSARMGAGMVRLVRMLMSDAEMTKRRAVSAMRWKWHQSMLAASAMQLRLMSDHSAQRVMKFVVRRWQSGTLSRVMQSWLRQMESEATARTLGRMEAERIEALFRETNSRRLEKAKHVLEQVLRQWRMGAYSRAILQMQTGLQQHHHKRLESEKAALQTRMQGEMQQAKEQGKDAQMKYVLQRMMKTKLTRAWSAMNVNYRSFLQWKSAQALEDAVNAKNAEMVERLREGKRAKAKSVFRGVLQSQLQAELVGVWLKMRSNMQVSKDNAVRTQRMHDAAMVQKLSRARCNVSMRDLLLAVLHQRKLELLSAVIHMRRHFTHAIHEDVAADRTNAHNRAIAEKDAAIDRLTSARRRTAVRWVVKVHQAWARVHQTLAYFKVMYENWQASWEMMEKRMHQQLIRSHQRAGFRALDKVLLKIELRHLHIYSYNLLKCWSESSGRHRWLNAVSAPMHRLASEKPQYTGIALPVQRRSTADTTRRGLDRIPPQGQSN